MKKHSVIITLFALMLALSVLLTGCSGAVDPDDPRNTNAPVNSAGS